MLVVLQVQDSTFVALLYRIDGGQSLRSDGIQTRLAVVLLLGRSSSTMPIDGLGQVVHKS